MTIVLLLMGACVAVLVLIHWVRQFSERPLPSLRRLRPQFRLRSLLLLMIVACLMLAFGRQLFSEGLVSIGPGWPMVVKFMLLAGFGVAATLILFVAAELWSGMHFGRPSLTRQIRERAAIELPATDAAQRDALSNVDNETNAATRRRRYTLVGASRREPLPPVRR